MLKLISTGLWKKRETDIENIQEAVDRLYQSQIKHTVELQSKFLTLMQGNDLEQLYTDSLIQNEQRKRTKSFDFINDKSDKKPKINHLRMRLCKPSNFKESFDTFRCECLEEDIEAKEKFEFEMGFKKRKRLYSQGQRINKQSITEYESILYDKRGYLLPPKTLTEYIYEEPTIEDCRNFLYFVKSPPGNLKRMLYFLREFLTNNSYFQKLFPKLKEQKPGRDLYLWIGITQFLILIFLIPFYTEMDKDYTNDSTDDFTINQFSGTMVLAVFLQIFIIIADRYFYISRSYLTIENQEIEKEEELINRQENENDETFSRGNTTTNKVNSVNLKSSIIMNYLPGVKNKFTDKQIKMFNPEEIRENGEDASPDENQEISLERSNSNKSIMLKYYFQLILLVLIHYLTFWYFPNKGNNKIQNHNYCDFSTSNHDMCNEVRLNPALWVFYLLY